MNDRIDPGGLEPKDPSDPTGNEDQDTNTLSPLPGEAGIPSVAQRRSSTLARKGLLAAGLLIASLIAVAALSLQRFSTSGKKPDDGEPKRVSDRPAAATTEPRKLELPPPPINTATTPAVSASAPRIPALVPTAQELRDAEPIGVRRTGTATNTTTAKPSPQDAPIMLVSTRPAAASPAALPARRSAAPPPQPGSDEAAPPDPSDPLSATARNLDAYQRQLQGLLDTLTQTAALATKQAVAEPGASPVLAPPPRSLTATPTNASSAGSGGSSGAGLFGGQLQGSATPRATASVLGNRSLTLPKGTAFTCALKTKVISAASGLVGCQVQRNVYSDDGRVLLIERGSHMDGEYRIAAVRPGTVRIPVLWTRIRTPNGVTVDIDSPGTGPLGESGIDGYVDNRWGERIGAALLLSLIDDAVKLTIQSQANERQAETVVLQSTADTTSKLAEKVLDSTINIPPLIYQNQGGIVGIYVARDVDFSSVYELRPSPAASGATR